MTATADAPAIARPVPAAPVGRTSDRELITPEGIDLHLQLADITERGTAFLIDTALMIAALVAMTLAAIAFVFLTRRPGVFELIGIIWLLGWFFLRNFYFMAFELTPRCATPGKRAVGLRVVSRNGGPLTFDAIFARNAMRELELFLPLSFVLVYARVIGGWSFLAGLVWCAIFALFPLFNSDGLRVGDFVAGTWVIRVPKRVLEPDLAQVNHHDDVYAFTRPELDAYGIRELSVLEEVIRRKDEATIRAVAVRIRTKIGRRTAAGESDQEFLETYYAALRAHLESKLLFGQRKRDKFDR
jgi:uncharacterized RDD family membrane protein YckC